MTLDLIIGEPPEFNEPPGGKCAFTQCDLDAVVEIEMELAHLEGAQPVKLCGEHQRALVVPTMPPVTMGAVIMARGKHFRVEDGRLIREDP